MTTPGSVIINNTLQLYMFISITLVILSVLCVKKKTKKRDTDTSRSASASVHEKTIKREESVAFNLKIKPQKESEKKVDEFDDDEENPLAKIPVKQRVPRQAFHNSASQSPSATTPSNLTCTTARTGGTAPKMEPEMSIFAANEKEMNRSLYVKLG